MSEAERIDWTECRDRRHKMQLDEERFLLRYEQFVAASKLASDMLSMTTSDMVYRAFFGKEPPHA